MFVTEGLFQLSMFVDKVWSLPEGAPLYGRLARLERPATDKHSSLLITLVNYGLIEFYNIESSIVDLLVLTRKDQPLLIMKMSIIFLNKLS
jgi:hypothetical protein